MMAELVLRTVTKRITVVMVLAATVGCEETARINHRPVFPVSGRVLVDGKPAGQARVVFVPAAGSDGVTPRPNALVREDGTFELSSYNPNDGAPEGEYLVSVRWRLPVPDEPGEFGPDLLKSRYVDHANSGLRVTVRAEPNVLSPFELSTTR